MVTYALDELSLPCLRDRIKEHKCLILIKGKLVLNNEEFTSYITDIDIKYQHIVVFFINHSKANYLPTSKDNISTASSPEKSMDKSLFKKMFKDKVREYFLEVEDMNISDLYDFVNDLLMNKKTDIAILLHLELRFADLKEYLLSYRDQLTFKDWNNNNMLHLACYYNNFELVKWIVLLEEEAQNNYDLTDRSFNMISDTSRDIKTMGNTVYKSNFAGLYEKNRWKPSEEENSFGDRPLQTAAKYCSYDIVYYLINKNKEQGFKFLNKNSNYIVTISMFNYGLRPMDHEHANYTCCHYGPDYNMDPIYGYRYVDKYEVAVGLFNMVTDYNMNLDIFRHLYVEDINKNIFDYFISKLKDLVEVFPSNSQYGKDKNSEWHSSETLISKLMAGIACGHYYDKDNMMMRLHSVISNNKHLFLDTFKYREKIKVILDIYNKNTIAFAYDINFVNWIKQFNVDTENKKYKVENEMEKKGQGKGFVPLWKKKFYEDVEIKLFTEYHPVSAVNNLWTTDLRCPMQQSYFNGSKPYNMPKHYNIVTYSAISKHTQPKYNKLFPMHVEKALQRPKSESQLNRTRGKSATNMDYNSINEKRQNIFLSENQELRMKLTQKQRRTEMRTRSNEGLTNVNTITTISLDKLKRKSEKHFSGKPLTANDHSYAFG